MSVLALPPGHTAWTQELADSLLPDDVIGREVLEGELIVPNSPSIRHQMLVGHLFGQLRDAAPAGWVVLTSPVDIRVPWGDVAQPDLVVCGPDGFDLDTGPTAPPELLVEVLSPSTRTYDLVVKRRLYERHGVGTYIVGDHGAGRLTLLERDDDGHLVETQHGPSVTLVLPFPVTLTAG